MVKFNSQTSGYIDSSIKSEKNRGRAEKREIFVYDDIYEFDKKWNKVVQYVKVVRTVVSKGKETKSTSYYLSTKKFSAEEYMLGIRNHWSIESALHYVKDVVFKEDDSKIRKGKAPVNLSVFRNFAISIYRNNGYSNIKEGIETEGWNFDFLTKVLK